MASGRIQIVQALADTLSIAGGPANVHQFRTRPIEKDALPAMVVYPTVPAGAGQAERVDFLDHDPGVERTLTVRIECRTEADSGTPPDVAVDPLYVWAVQRAMADPTLGGLVKQTAERSVSYDAREAGSVYAACAVDFELIYYTDERDPEVLL